MDDKRDCDICIHKKVVEINGTFVRMCEKWDCEFESVFVVPKEDEKNEVYQDT